jgi:hypothetical protein
MLDIQRVAASAPRSGRGGRRFKSCHSDQHLAEDPKRPANPSANPKWNEQRTGGNKIGLRFYRATDQAIGAGAFPAARRGAHIPHDHRSGDARSLSSRLVRKSAVGCVRGGAAAWAENGNRPARSGVGAAMSFGFGGTLGAAVPTPPSFPRGVWSQCPRLRAWS